MRSDTALKCEWQSSVPMEASVSVVGNLHLSFWVLTTFTEAAKSTGKKRMVTPIQICSEGDFQKDTKCFATTAI